MNRSIDDDNGDSVTAAKPGYRPGFGWSRGAQCMTCSIHPGITNASRAFDLTWHDGTYLPGEPDRVITLSFTGTAVYVYNLIANVVPSTATLTNLSFSIDGTYIQQYIHVPDGSQAQILYSVPVFSHAGLSNQPHTLEMRATGPNASLILFDVVLYTVPDGPASSSSSPGSLDAPQAAGSSQPSGSAGSSQPSGSSVTTHPDHHSLSTGAIVGLVAGLIGFGLIAFLFSRFWRRYGYRNRSSNNSILQYHGTPRTPSVRNISKGVVSPPCTNASNFRYVPAATHRTAGPDASPWAVLPPQRRKFGSHPLASPAGSPSPISGQFSRRAQYCNYADPEPTESLERNLATRVASESQDNHSQSTGYTLGVLRAQITALQGQMDRLIDVEQSMHEGFREEPPPSYAG